MPVFRLEEFITEKAVLDAASKESSRVIMIIGECDTGKSTLAWTLLHYLSGTFITGIIDADMGQSNIGPPTTIAWGILENSYTDWKNIHAENIYFTGALSPSGNILPVLVGGKKMLDRALDRCEKVVVDTTGMISEPEGRLLKQYKIELLDPAVILALERAEELQPILAPLEGRTAHSVIRLNVPESIRRKTAASRTIFRNEQFKRYFGGAKLVDISLDLCSVRFSGAATQNALSCLKGVPVSFRDNQNTDIAIGIIEGVKVNSRRLLIRTVADLHGGYSHLVIGNEKTRIELG
jgi:polynucleotide 5'-hydroxyl-kinase GRC3/NOL9